MRLDEKYKSLFDKYQINTPIRKAHFMAQIEHESGLKPISENLNYSTKTLISVFKKRFDRNKDGFLDSEEKKKILDIAGKPEKVANFVYANINGNGPESSGDGWKFRGRGFLQITAKNNYSDLSKATGIDYVKYPDLLLKEADAMISALWFWKTRSLNKYADLDDIKAITRRVNGGYNGLSHREDLLKKWKKVYGI